MNQGMAVYDMVDTSGKFAVQINNFKFSSS